MNYGIKKALVKFFIVALFVCLAFFGFTIAESFSAIATNELQIFEIENGAYIKAVSQDSITDGGDTNAIRFKFTMNKSFVELNDVVSVKAKATIKGIEILNKNFEGLEALVADGDYVHNFDFANFPSNYYGEVVSLNITANFSSGGSKTVSLDRSMEYVAIMATLNTEENYISTYVGGSNLYINYDNIQVGYGDSVKISMPEYDGAEIKSVYLNSEKHSDTALISPVASENAILIDSSLLQADRTYSVVATTVKGDAIYIESIKTLQSLDDIRHEEIYVVKGETNTFITMPNAYDVKEISISGSKITGEIADNIISINNSFIPSGKIELNLHLNNSQKVIMPLYVFDEKYEIKTVSDFKNWVTACVEANTWDEENNVGKKYVYATLENSLSSVGSVSIDTSETSCASGVFDGQGYSISGLTVSKDSLFYRSCNFVMKNVGFIGTKYKTAFLTSSTVEVKSTSLINCYFNVQSSKGEYIPFVKSSGIDLVENVIFNTNISYNSSPTIFGENSPKSVRNLFVIGKNTRKSTVIEPVTDTCDAVNYGSAKTVSEFITGVNSNNFNVSEFSTNNWDFTNTSHFWIVK